MLFIRDVFNMIQVKSCDNTIAEYFLLKTAVNQTQSQKQQGLKSPVFLMSQTTL